MADIIFPNVANAFAAAQGYKSQELRNRILQTQADREADTYSRQTQARAAFDPRNPNSALDAFKLDPQIGAQAQTFLGNEQQFRIAHQKQLIDNVARAGMAVLSVPPQAQAAEYASQRQRLIQMGVPASSIPEQYDPQRVRAFIQQAQSPADYLAQPTAGGMPVSQLQSGGGQAAPAPAAAPPSNGNLPRGIRNNNPLNIEAGRFTQNLPGFAGSDGRFARFESPEQGIAAADRLLLSYAGRGLNTVAGIVGRWAPSSDGNNVSAYAGAVARQLGVDPNQPLDMNDPQVRQALIMAMGQHENGRPINNLTSVPGAPVQVASAGGMVPPSIGAGALSAAPMGAPVPSPVAPPGAPQGLTTPQLTAPGPAPAAATPPNLVPVLGKYGAPWHGSDKDGTKLPPGWVYFKDPATGQLVPKQIPEFEKETAEVVDPNSPTGSRIVRRSDAVGKPSRESLQQRTTVVNQLSDDFRKDKNVDKYQAVEPIMRSVREAVKRPGGAAEINLVYAMAQIFDPGSVVREAEVILGQRSGGPVESIKALTEWAQNGGRMNAAVRDRILKELESRTGKMKKAYDAAKEFYENRAKRMGIDPKEITYTVPEDVAPPPPQPGEIRDGFRFKGGHPGDQNSWEPVQ